MLLIMIYLVFFSVGLPNSMLGAAWPSIQEELSASAEWMGIIAAICAGGTILSSLLCVRIVNRFGTGRTVVYSLLMTVAGLIGYLAATSPYVICAASLLIGLSAGCLVATLNAYLSLHYEARHLNWVHCFWGVGSMVGPALLTLSFQAQHAWRGGYVLAACCVGLILISFAFTLPRWKAGHMSSENGGDSAGEGFVSNQEALRMTGIKTILFLFLSYYAAESCMTLWITSFAGEVYALSEGQAAMMASIFFLGITAGRGVSGFINMKLGCFTFVRYSVILMLIGIVVLLLGSGYIMCILGVLLTGLGCASINPCMVHEIPVLVGRRASQAVTALQQAASSLGSMLMPLVTGFLFGQMGVVLMPWWMLCFTIVLLILLHMVKRNRITKANSLC